MAGKIPRSFIDDLLNRVDIVEVIGTRVPLRKAGKDFQACCPFHNEKTPSFTVSQDKQFYHCFGCGAHGSAIGFLMDYENVDFVEAIEELAAQLGLEVPREDGESTGPDYRPLFDALEQAAAFYRRQLRRHADATQAITYLKSRGLSGEIAARFGLGYAPPGWDNLMQAQGASPSDMEHLRTIGMIARNEEGREYDRFRDRIMFPIRDPRGRTIGFGGRLLGDGKPKYLNSPETPLFHKGRELFGLYEARKANRNLSRLLVVEGYMDVIALAQFGLSYAVATLGTATTAEHAERLFKSAPEIVFCFDGDRAGHDAAWKAMETILPLMRDGREVRFLILPQGEDPDSLIRKEGRESFDRRASQSMPLSEFLFQRLGVQVDMSSLGGRARLAELAKPLLGRLPMGLFQDMMQTRLAELVGVDPSRIEMPGTTTAEIVSRNKPMRTDPARDRQTMTPVRRAMILLINHPELALIPDLPHNWKGLQAPGVNLLWELLAIVQNQPNIKSVQIVERWRGQQEFSHLMKLLHMADELLVPPGGETSEFVGTLEKLEQRYYKQEEKSALTKLSPKDLTDEDRKRLKELNSRQK